MTENKPVSPDEFEDEAPDRSKPERRAIIDETPVRRGRPPLPAPEISTTIRLDADVPEKSRATGPGGQGRINAALKASKP